MIKRENPELVSLTTQLKLIASDGKKYNTGTLDNQGIIEVSKNFLSKRVYVISISMIQQSFIRNILEMEKHISLFLNIQ